MQTSCNHMSLFISKILCNLPQMVLLLAALFMKFIFDKYAFTSGGALGSITLGLFVKELWARGQPQMFAIPETNREFSRGVSSCDSDTQHACVFQNCFSLLHASVLNA